MMLQAATRLQLTPTHTTSLLTAERGDAGIFGEALTAAGAPLAAAIADLAAGQDPTAGLARVNAIVVKGLKKNFPRTKPSSEYTFEGLVCFGGVMLDLYPRFPVGFEYELNTKTHKGEVWFTVGKKVSRYKFTLADFDKGNYKALANKAVFALEDSLSA